MSSVEEDVRVPHRSRLALLGAGVMGETVLSGLVRAGWDPADLVATDRRPERVAELEAAYGITMTDNVGAVAGASTVVLVVKPQDMRGLLDEIAPALAPDALVVSLAAGVDTATLEAGLPAGQPVVRVMANTPAQVDEGMAAVAARLARRPTTTSNGSATSCRPPAAWRSCPSATWTPSRRSPGRVPAYLFFVVEAMIEAGVHLGLPRDLSTELVVQTMLGSAKLLRESGEHPTVLRERVTSPGGTTAAALRELEDHKVRAAFLSAMEAARDRSRSLAAAAREQQAGA